MLKKLINIKQLNKKIYIIFAGFLLVFIVSGFLLENNKKQVTNVPKPLTFTRQFIGEYQYKGEVKGVMTTSFGNNNNEGKIEVQSGESKLSFSIPLTNSSLNSGKNYFNPESVSFKSDDKIIEAKYNLIPNGLKEEIILNRIPQENKLPIKLKTENLKLKITPDGIPVFYDDKGHYQFHFERPFMKDGSGNISYGVKYLFGNEKKPGGRTTKVILGRSESTTPESLGMTMMIEIDSSWLHDPKRVLPITIDPTVVHDTSAEFATGQQNRVKDTGSGASPVLETYYQELPADQYAVGLWHMNEASGNALDSSGNGNTGTPTGTTIVTGLQGNARSFSGTDSISVGTGSSLNQTSTVTVEAWIKLNSYGGSYASIFNKRAVGNTTGYTFELYSTTGGLQTSAPGGSCGTSNTAAIIPLNTWTHVAAVFSVPTNSAIIYVNGISKATGVCTSIISSSDAAIIGKNIVSSTVIDGTIDEIRVSNIARTPEEIKSDASRRPYSQFTSDVIDISNAASWNSFTWTELGVNTGDGETLKDATSLVGQWNFNDTPSTATAVSGGSCGASCNGTLTSFSNTTAYDIVAGSGWTQNNARWPGNTPKALMFNGTSDYLSVADGSSLSFGNGTTDSPFSISIWVNPKNFTANQWLINKRNTSNDEYQLVVGASGEVRSALFSGLGSTIYIGKYTSTSLILGSWNHVVFTYDGSANESGIKIYINGKLSGLSSNSAGSYVAMNNGTSPLIFSKQGWAAGGYFQGVIDSTTIFSRALSASEIISNYQAGNIELQTRVGADSSPDDGSWEAWKPTTGETAIENYDGPYEYNITDTNLKSYWPMDETTDNSCSGGSNDICDKKGTADGAATGTKVIDGQYGKARYFNGSSDAISVPNSTDWEFGSGDFTVEWWEYRTGAGVGGSPAIARDNSTTFLPFLLGYYSGGSDLVYMSSNGSSWDIASAKTLGVTSLNQWVHLAVTRSGTTFFTYKNGFQQDTWTSAAALVSNSNALSIGFAQGSQYYVGELDEIRIYKGTALSAVTIQQHALAGSTRPQTLHPFTDLISKIEGSASQKIETGRPIIDSNTIGLWHLDETGGTSAYLKDSSGTTTPASATGGTITTSGGYTIHTFNSSGTFTPTGTGYVEILVVGAGGGGNLGGGGGGGIKSMGYAVNNGIGYTVTVGTGTAGAAGGNSVFDTVTATGGGQGGTFNQTGFAGGSGGGGGENDNQGGTFAGGAGTAGQGTTGGTTAPTTVTHGSNGGGGGGASAVGGTSPGGKTGGAGGAGVASSISGSSVTYGGGGGGGATTATSGATGGTGGAGGGGAGASANNGVNTAGAAGTANTGGGGGGGNNGGPGAGTLAGYAGGSGVVIIRYPTTPVLNHATPTGTSVVNGIVSKARLFTSGNRLNITSNGSFSVANNFSIEAWIKLGPAGAAYSIASKYQADTTGWTFFRHSDNKFYIQGGDGIAWLSAFNCSTSGTWTDSNWHHVAATVGSTISIYVDGVAALSGCTRTADVRSNTTDFVVGGYSAGGNYVGTIDEMRLSNIARSTEEMAESYRAGRDHYINKTISSTDLSGKQSLPFYVAADRPGSYLTSTIGESAFANYQPDANTVGLWHLDEQSGSGAYIKDGSGLANNVTPTGTTFTQGQIGKGRNFNGSSDYLACSDANCGGSTKLDLGTANWSYGAWIKTSSATRQAIMSKGNGDWTYELGVDASGIIRNDLFNTVAGTYIDLLSTQTVADGKWHYIVSVFTLGSTKLETYIDGRLSISTTSTTGTIKTDSTAEFDIGRRADGNFYFNGQIDEAFAGRVARTATEIRQAYEVGLRSHPITIDFGATLDSGNLITGSGDLGFTVDATYYGLNSKGSNIYSGDKIIVRENYDGTEYIAQGTVTSVNISTGAVTVSAWDSGSTFPSGGYTVGASIFKWQREYWNINNETLDSHTDAITNLTLRLTNGAEGRTIWLDDLKSNTDYLTTPGGSTITSSTGNRYFQYRIINHSFDEAVSSSVTNVAIDYTTPIATLDLPTNTATNQSVLTALKTTMTNANAAYLQYKIELCTNAGMTLNCQTFDQTLSQTGWSGQNAQTGTAYTSGTQATYTIQTPLNPSSTYYWRSYAIDPGGNNVWSNTQGSPYSYSTTTLPTAPTTPYTEGAANPARIFDTTPEFSAIHNDPDADAANKYQIQVNTNSGFTGTVMWDSGEQSMSSTANGARSSDISYAGTTLSFNSSTYYWRIRFTDVNGAVSPWSSTQNFTMDQLPNTPTLDYPATGTISVPVLAILKTTATDYNGDYLRYKIQICTNAIMTIGCQTYDQTSSQTGWSGQNTQSNTAYNSGSQASYTVQSALSVNTDYYWRSYVKDPAGSNTWSNTQTTVFVFSTTPIVIPSAPTALLTNGSTNPTGVLTATLPYFSAIHNDIDNQSSSYYQIKVSNQPDVNGSILWDSGQTSMSTITNGSRSANITYAGSALSLNGQIFYWMIRFWDSSGNPGNWSSPASFTLFSLVSPAQCMSIKSNQNTQITINWLDQTSSEDGYYIEKKTDGGGFTNLVTKAANSITHVDSAVSSGHSYQYRVRSKTGSDYSDWCTTALLDLGTLGGFQLF